MGQHTYFYKDRDRYIYEQELNAQISILDTLSDNSFIVDITNELKDIRNELKQLIDEIDNESEFHNIFRCSRRNEDGSYKKPVLLFSLVECYNYINDPLNKIRLSEEWVRELTNFWHKYPKGIVEVE